MVKIDNLGTEKRNPKTDNLDSLTTLQILQLMNEEDSNVLNTIKESLNNINDLIQLAKEIGFFSCTVTTNAQMDISWINPSSGTALKERVYAGGKGNEGMRLKYRSGVRISETGEWKIQVYPREVPDRFRGLGLIVDRNGTR